MDSQEAGEVVGKEHVEPGLQGLQRCTFGPERVDVKLECWKDSDGANRGVRSRYCRSVKG